MIMYKSITTLEIQTKEELREIKLNSLLNTKELTEFKFNNEVKYGKIQIIPKARKYKNFEDLQQDYFNILNNMMKNPKEFPFKLNPNLFDRNDVEDNEFENDQIRECYNSRKLISRITQCKLYLIGINSLNENENEKINLIIGEDCQKFFTEITLGKNLLDENEVVNIIVTNKIPKNRIIITTNQSIINSFITPGIIIDEKNLTITQTKNSDNNFIWIDIDYPNKPIYY